MNKRIPNMMLKQLPAKLMVVASTGCIVILLSLFSACLVCASATPLSHCPHFDNVHYVGGGKWVAGDGNLWIGFGYSPEQGKLARPVLLKEAHFMPTSSIAGGIMGRMTCTYRTTSHSLNLVILTNHTQHALMPVGKKWRDGSSRYVKTCGVDMLDVTHCAFRWVGATKGTFIYL